MSTQTKTVEQVPNPATPEGSIHLYTPEQAAEFLHTSALQLKRSWYARRVAYTATARGHRMTGAQICEHIQAAAVRPLSETKRVPRQRAA